MPATHCQEDYVHMFVVTVTGIDSEATQGWSSTYQRDVQVLAPSAAAIIAEDVYTEILLEFLAEDLGAPVYAFDIESVRLASDSANPT